MTPIRRTVALAGDKLGALRNASRQAAVLVARGVTTKQEAADALYCIACAHDLPHRFGNDRVQAAMAEGFTERRPR